jgi:uncharacterized protein YjbJ (UPF0337 family)
MMGARPRWIAGAAKRGPVADRGLDVSTCRWGIIMTINKDQIKGELKDLGGKIQEEAGKLIGSKEQQAKGLKHQAEGKLQKGVGEMKEAVKKA